MGGAEGGAEGVDYGPVWPKAAMKPMALEWRCRGRSLVASDMTMGYRGPMSTPLHDSEEDVTIRQCAGK